MTQQLRALPPLTEDQGPVLGTHLATHNCLMPAPGDPMASTDTSHVVHIYTCMQNTYTLKIKINIKKYSKIRKPRFFLDIFSMVF